MTAYSWTNGGLDENGVKDKYNEFNLSNFNESIPFFKINPDDDGVLSIKKETTMDSNKGSRKNASYVGELSSGFDAHVGVNDYEAGTNKQIGKKHEEEVDAPNWHSDKRNAIGKAAAARLRQIADVLDKVAAGSFDSALDGKGALSDYKNDNDILVSAAIKQAFEENASSDDHVITAALKSIKTAEHPIDHAPRDDKDVSDVAMDAQTGDDEWVDIGPGEFDDKRDEVGRALKSGQ